MHNCGYYFFCSQNGPQTPAMHTQYGAWGPTMSSPARAARAAHAGLGTPIRPLTPDELGASAAGGAVASGPSAVPPFE